MQYDFVIVLVVTSLRFIETQMFHAQGSTENDAKSDLLQNIYCE